MSQRRVRTAGVEELPALQEIERAAGEVFREIGMSAIAEDEPPSLAQLADRQRAGLAWVALDAEGRPAAYLIAHPLDGSLHLEQLSVHPGSARRGVGRALIEHAAAHARAGGLPALTLTAFADVPWNAPYDERCGFRRLEDLEPTPGLRELRLAEGARGLDRWPRVCMRRDL